MKWVWLDFYMMCPICLTKFFKCDLSECPHCGAKVQKEGDADEVCG